MKSFYSLCFLALACSGIAGFAPASQPADSEKMLPLKTLNWMVGSWRGIGQPKRGSTRGAWSEKMTCQWGFQKEPQILLNSNGGKEFTQLTMTSHDDGKSLRLLQTKGDTERVYLAEIPDEWSGKLELLSEPDSEGVTWKCTLQQLSDIRATLLFERRSTPTGSFRRIAGIGYTRSGAKLAQGATGKRTCVVTGGAGTIPVKHKGKTYYVCCQGCVQAFNAAPDEIIADYLASLKKD